MKRKLALGLAVVMAFSLPGAALTAQAEQTKAADTEAAAEAEESGDYEYEEVFAQWNLEAPALNTLIDYVEDVTDESSENYIPAADRIAVFDMDGTIYGELFPTYLEYYMLAWRILEDPRIEPDEEMLEVGRTIRDCALDKSFPEDMPVQHAIQAARAYSGLTLDEFSDYVTEILIRDADGFEGMTYGEAFYQPILEVIEYLQENDFEVYVVSGSDRFICRTLLEGTVDIPYANIIGMDDAVMASGQGTTDGLDYLYTDDDQVIRTDELLIKNLKMNKICQIVRDIGRQPVLSFGNSSGDCSMHNYTLFDNRYKSAAFMLIADDEVRDYGNTEKTRALGEQWKEAGYNVISMRDDWKTIYGEGVVKTGTFHWMEELAEDRQPAETFKNAAGGLGQSEYIEKEAAQADDTQAEDSQEEASSADDAQADDTQAEDSQQEASSADDAQAESASGDVQYVMYLGTNDKDTGEPVASHEECMEKAKDILISHFGGYTVTDAEGGWTNDDGEKETEYTIVIYLSDTTLEEVHAAADDMLKEFNQSSVLIQENPTNTEFYAG